MNLLPREERDELRQLVAERMSFQRFERVDPYVIAILVALTNRHKDDPLCDNAQRFMLKQEFGSNQVQFHPGSDLVARELVDAYFEMIGLKDNTDGLYYSEAIDTVKYMIKEFVTKVVVPYENGLVTH